MKKRVSVCTILSVIILSIVIFPNVNGQRRENEVLRTVSGVSDPEDSGDFVTKMDSPTHKMVTDLGVMKKPERNRILAEDDLQGWRSDAERGGTDQPLERVRRSFLIDSGYGSRLQEGSNLAQSTSALRDVFGRFGPGKRKRNYAAIDHILTDTYSGNDNRGELPKRFVPAGYDSRAQAGIPLADSLLTRDRLFASRGPSKRSGYIQSLNLPDYFTKFGIPRISDYNGQYPYSTAGYPLSRLVPVKDLRGKYPREVDNIVGDVLQRYSPISGVAIDNFGGDVVKRYISDAGFGSRIQTAANIAQSSGMRDSVFGAFGPGRKKKDIEYVDSVDHSDKYTDTGDGAMETAKQVLVYKLLPTNSKLLIRM